MKFCKDIHNYLYILKHSSKFYAARGNVTKFNRVARLKHEKSHLTEGVLTRFLNYF
jgi:hypothetical protein